MSENNHNTNPADIFTQWGLRVDLSDPDVQKFMQATGIPESEWEQFERRHSAAVKAQREIRSIPVSYVETATTEQIPDELRELGVVRAIKDTLNWDVRYTLVFDDETVLHYHEPLYQWGEPAKSASDLFRDMVRAVQIHRVLPFD